MREPQEPWTLQRELETLVVLARCDDPQVALRAIGALWDLMRQVRATRPHEHYTHPQGPRRPHRPDHLARFSSRRSDGGRGVATGGGRVW
jgi:hypothetical protein